LMVDGAAAKAGVAAIKDVPAAKKIAAARAARRVSAPIVIPPASLHVDVIARSSCDEAIQLSM